MNQNIIYIAAWIIILKFVYEGITSLSEQRRIKIEALAVLSEFGDPATTAERKKALVARHPGLLIHLPEGRYFVEAERQFKDRKAPEPPRVSG